MVQPTERMVALAERNLARQYRTKRVSGLVQGADGPLRIYTDGSVDGSPSLAGGLGWVTGWGYLSTDGRYGCGKIPQFARAGSSVVQVTQLRAIWHAIRDLISTQPLTVVTGCQAVARTLDAWRCGSTEMPRGYAGKTARGIPTLERLRQAVAAHPGNLSIEHVMGHGGDVLNDGADTLARLGRRWARDDLATSEVQQRAMSIAEAFLNERRRT